MGARTNAVPAALPTAIAPILDVLQGKRIGRFVGGALCIAAAALFELPESRAFCEWANMDGPEGGVVWLLRVPALGFVLAGAWLVALGVRKRPGDEPILRLLLDDPGSIVWVHTNLVVEQRAYGATVGRSRFLFLMTTRGSGLSLEMPDARVAKVLDGLESYLPHATFGWTEERLKRYREGPESLRITSGETPYRGKPAGDTTKLRPPAGAPFGVGALLVGALLLVRFLLLTPDFTCGGAKPTAAVPVAPAAVALPPTSSAAVATPARVSIPGDVAVDDKFVYYTVDDELRVEDKVATYDQRIIARSASLGPIATSRNVLYYLADGALWKVPAHYELPVRVADGPRGASSLVIAGRHAYALAYRTIRRIDLSGDASEPDEVADADGARIATDGSRVLFARVTLRTLDDRTGKVTDLLPGPVWIGGIAACGSAVYYVQSGQGSSLFSTADMAHALAPFVDGRAVACGRDAVYWVDDVANGESVIRRRSTGGKTTTLAASVPFNAQLAVDGKQVWFTVLGGVSRCDTSAAP